MSKVVRVKITQRMIDALPKVEKETWTMDSEVPGLGIRQRPNATAAWCLRFKVPATGKDKKDTIGPVGQVTLDYARNIARQRMGELAVKGDIMDRRLEERLRLTVSDLVKDVITALETKGKAATYVRDFKHQCRDHVEKQLGTMLVREVTQTDVDRVLTKLRDRPYLHNRVRSNLSKLFNVAIRERLRTDNPVFGAEKTPEEARDRVLDDTEVSNLLKALDANPCMEADVIRLLYLTGSRPKELLSARWEDIRIPEDTEQPVIWTKPAQTVKQRRKHVVELSPLAGAVLRRIKEEAGDVDEGDWVFPSRKDPEQHMVEYKDYWALVAKEAGIAEARPYDLRKSFASRVIAATDIKTAMSLTGHTQSAVFLKHYAKLMKGRQSEALAKVNWTPAA